MTTFAELGVPPKLVDALARRGVTEPFPIQAMTVADALAGRDLSVRAPTGSGKTLAFALPLAAGVGKGVPGRPRALILVPTRELASQVCDVLRPLGQARNRTVAAFYGGTPLGRDRQRLARGIDIAVACPGRLADLVRRRDVNLGDVDLVVIDEADRMADMGFLPEVRRLLDQTSAERQTLLFSATLDGDVDVLVRRYQREPVRHELAVSEEAQGAVRHFFWHSAANERVQAARDIVRASGPAIIFTRTKHAADRVARQLEREGVQAVAIHGNRSQGQRERALAAFSAGRVATLVATDVAARGIHVDNVGVVVHFDPPATDKDYVHRSGRTGRAGADGLVVTLVAPDKLRDVKSLQRALAMPQRVEVIAIEQLTDGGAPRRTLIAPVIHTDHDRLHATASERGHRQPARNGRPAAKAGAGKRRGHRPSPSKPFRAAPARPTTARP